MKKIILPYFLFFFPNFFFGQTIFEKFKNNEEVTLINIPPQMFQILGKMSIKSGEDKTDNLFEMIQSIKTFKALLSSSSSVILEMKKWVNNEAKLKNLENILSLKEKVKSLLIYSTPSEKIDSLKSILMLSIEELNPINQSIIQVQQFNAVLLFIEGEIDLKKIGNLIYKMNLPGGNLLKQLNF